MDWTSASADAMVDGMNRSRLGHQVSVRGTTYARLSDEAKRRGDSVTSLVEAALEGDWNRSLDAARADRRVAVSHSRGIRTQNPKRVTFTIAHGRVAEQIAAASTDEVDRAIDQALDAAGAP